eukprot:TRINITY_DN18672_c0_g1_i1.p1 TRINITY_DN18672_c0_g1~~TRINITY_DN18672_c0_g1_i1.p1  ORF type:complete len:326 (-),score=52.09 TRINITY_DN18672_c0_g1_i1:19-996(-)
MMGSLPWLTSRSAKYVWLPVLLLRIGCEARGSSSSTQATVDPSAEMADQWMYQVTFMMSADRPPFSYYDPEQGITGFEVDLLSQVCAEAGLECPVILAPHTEAWASDTKGYMGTGLRRGDFDCATSFGSKAVRMSGPIFSYPYTTPEAGLLLVRDASVWPGVSGKTVGVVDGSSCDKQAASKLLTSSGMVVRYSNGQELMSSLKAQSVDAAFVCGEEYVYRLSGNMTHAQVAARFQAVSEGLSIMCHPRKATQVQLLNLGIDALRIKDSGLVLMGLCQRWNVSCEYTRLGSSALAKAAAPSAAVGIVAVSRLCFISFLVSLSSFF